MTTEKPKKVMPKSPGRPAGAKNKRTLAMQKQIAASGLTPLEYMLTVMRNPKADSKRRDAMAAAAAPYVHSKLASVEHRGPGANGEHTLVHKITRTIIDPLADAIDE